MIRHSELSYKRLLESLPSPLRHENIRQQIKEVNTQQKRKMIVLDDDPTGSQTVHNLFVLTSWDKEILRKAFNDSHFMFYILTNTRSFNPEETEAILREIIRNVTAVAKELDCSFSIINRGDSTLRGHYPLEIDVITDEIHRLSGEEFDGQVIIPAFFEGKRYTYRDVHYIEEKDQLIPVSQTEFSKDKSFGFTESNLCKWIAEKTNGRIPETSCLSISVEQIRKGPEKVLDLLLQTTGNQPIIVNALCYEDLDTAAMALIKAEQQGKKFIYRTAASFVKSYGGVDDQPYLTKEEMVIGRDHNRGGLVIVGSHVKKTTNQLQQLLADSSLNAVEINVNHLLENDKRDEEINRINRMVHSAVESGTTTVVYTSRELIYTTNRFDNLAISQRISKALTDVIQSLTTAPKFIIAKGGITSSDIATLGLEIKMAKVIGQAAPGIPVWLTGEEAKFSGVPYIIFPGNVGEDSTLLEIVLKLT
ncbi:hydroxyacid dehydrogenase [Bacillus sp. S3]|uniref:four-carbon acid sugar kinase family protein n=1 Tax=Bacillus sp. S3 TaxID=486398 RepID=UPI001189E37A|nr:four-carbon acid sugar kinase family protein [Bacillus sp. S3]QCJ44736.1 hydroxyacid dehydrogenase [Bacillus sp. S3]